MKGKPATEYCKQTFCLNKPQSDMVLTTDGEKVQTRNNLPGEKKKKLCWKMHPSLEFHLSISPETSPEVMQF